MAKKIQLSTVRQEANVEVVFVNAALICKVINSHNVLARLIDTAEVVGSIKHPTKTVLDENGEPCYDENGYLIQEPICDQHGNPIANYDLYRMDSDELKNLNEVVLPFLSELRNALEGDE